MKKLDFDLVALLISLLAIACLMLGCGTGNKKQKIVNALHAYTDSVDITINELFELDRPLNWAKADAKQALDAANANLNKRVAIRKRMSYYQRKIDSLNNELEKKVFKKWKGSDLQSSY